MGLTTRFCLKEMKHDKLSKLADIQTGLVLTRKETRSTDSESFQYRSLNLRSLNLDGTINYTYLEKYFAREGLNETFIARKNDIIIGLFPPFNLTLINEESQGLVIPSQFVIVRKTVPNLVPGYLFCYLSHNELLRKLALRETGQLTGSLKVSALAALKIPLPPLHKQKEVAAFFEMSDVYKKLTKELLHQFSLREITLMEKVIGETLHGND